MIKSHKALPALVSHTSYLSHLCQLIVALHEVDWEKAPTPVICRTYPPVLLANLQYPNFLASFER